MHDRHREIEERLSRVMDERIQPAVRKVARTAANVAHLIDDCDDLVHVMSSAQQWEWLLEHHPQLFARVREQVDAGRFVPSASR